MASLRGVNQRRVAFVVLRVQVEIGELDKLPEDADPAEFRR